jgi:hypothetical protein
VFIATCVLGGHHQAIVMNEENAVTELFITIRGFGNTTGCTLRK